MQKQDLKDLISKGNKLYERVLKREFHFDQPYSIIDLEYTRNLLSDFKMLSGELPKIEGPKSLDEILVYELSKICNNQIQNLEDEFNPSIKTPEQVISMYEVTSKDLDEIKKWLSTNKDKVIAANLRQMEAYSSSRRSEVALGSPKIRVDAEFLVLRYVDNFKKVLSEFFSDFPGVPQLLDEYIISVESDNSRSYADKVAKASYLSVAKCCYMLDGKINLIPERLISLLGHEVLGHCLNYINTDLSDLPLYIKENLNAMTSASKESVADHFESLVFEFLNGNKNAADSMGFEEDFENIYNRFKDTRILMDYWNKLSMVGYWILSNTKVDDFNKQVKELLTYSIDIKWPASFVNRHRQDWNRSTGLLLPKFVSELRYSVNPVKEMLAGVNDARKSKIEKLILVGNWTPTSLKYWISVNS
ncbi:hypothetical protein A3F07_02190 [candidate division WWE3 bacterium RIFCSPHIGHO2_12_FULL_38_15]|uniref:DUF1704 domain-containing protein n=1 Tax=candidate division WWE3 bacterium RIFCSPHIGHO2_02_FULL_38_14 TaxID=1802620 RepID=A0A1F4V8D1_UNCKA|nr:MAG: hypothetical protein A2793_03425 [candidate division WWE3 bacterium RIFCSPHIGHO2_01_FULL_38_45]OGC48690.1 MAG: hypothetical protein A3F07_02190 [candidate division WWE3 bacterium RIFCSPHIGHO2_12_FULL_38_15]OGC53096.1 MAG: hypothetical protein A3B64_01450 [candidate division WWE3 bacterium RIFCSPLOWO2_01_FULL_37_24]OGC53459.1 MAG: hypothetical protein A3D91_00305 [candidate division WWE3 bacterium RIFCSPHIGHO2_02_FULL_38_14]HLB51933.1 hypothetical protein [Patescibacteria group bacterium